MTFPLLVNKSLLMAVCWGGAAALSYALLRWGEAHPEPLQAPFGVVLAVVLTPALILGMWLLIDGRGESTDCDQETH